MQSHTISHYRILEKIGAGGMGVVYKAMDLRLRRTVALKLLPPELAVDPRRKAQLLHEARLAAQLDHPHIVGVYEADETDDGSLFLAMPYHPGESLAARLVREDMPLDQVLLLGIQVGEALAAAHGHGIIHRDVKPSNILITAGGEAKLLDFGLAMSGLVDPLEPITTAPGTLRYMSPEQVRGAHLDHRTDLWSLGATLYEVLAGRPCFTGGSPVDTVELILHAEPPPLPAPADGSLASASLPAVIERCLRKDREERYGDADELLAELRSLRGNLDAGRGDGLPDAPTEAFRLSPASTAGSASGGGSGHGSRPGHGGGPGHASGSRHGGGSATGRGGGSGPGLWSSLPGHDPGDSETTLLAAPTRRPAGRRRWAAVAAAVLAVTAAVLLVVRPWGDGGPGEETTATAAGASSLVVLPFANLTGDEELDYLGDGVAAGLIGRLSEVDGLRLVGRSMAAGYRDLESREAGRLLGVAWLLDGHVQGGSDQLRVTANLTDARDGTLLWSGSFEGSEEGVFGLQHRIATGLIDALHMPLSSAARDRLGEGPTDSQRAYRLYLKGRRLLDVWPEADAAERAEGELRRALKVDPDFALARATLSEALWRRFQQESDPALGEAAEAEARRAREEDPDLPEAVVALARAQRSAGRAESGIAGIEAVLADHPHPAEALRELGNGYWSVGQVEQAERCYRRAVSLQPDDWRAWNSLGSFHLQAGDFDAALAAYRRADRLAPPSVTWPRQNVAAALMRQGKYRQVVDTVEGIGAAITDPVMASNLGTAHFFLGDLERAEELYRRAVSLDPGNATLHRNLGDLHLRRGRREEAVASWRRALTVVERGLGGQHHPARLPLDRAVLLAKVGDCGAALEAAAALASSLPASSQNSHDLAQAWALCGETEAALDALERAVAAGWSAELAGDEDEFRSLAGHPRFRALTGSG